MVNADLTAIGFSRVTCLIGAETAPGVTLYSLVFERRSAVDMAAASVVGVSRRAGGVREAYSVSFSAALDDDTAIHVDNGIGVGSPVTPRRRRVWHFPGTADLAVLYRIHQALTSRSLGGHHKRLPQDGQYGAACRDDVCRYLEELVAAGYVYLDASAEYYRYTWKGAYLAAWSQLWPMSALQRCWTKRQATRLLKELGLPADYATIDYSCVVRRNS